MAGTYIYRELIEKGLDGDNIAFFTAERGSLRAFQELCARKADVRLPKYTFEKKISDYPKVRKWLNNKFTKSLIVN